MTVHVRHLEVSDVVISTYIMAYECAYQVESRRTEVGNGKELGR